VHLFIQSEDPQILEAAGASFPYQEAYHASCQGGPCRAFPYPEEPQTQVAEVVLQTRPAVLVLRTLVEVQADPGNLEGAQADQTRSEE